MLIYKQKHLFAAFETTFAAFTILFLAVWRYFCVDRIYRCKDTREIVFLPAFKPVLLHFPFFFALWKIFCVVRMYRCQNKGENVCYFALKPIIWYSLFLFFSTFELLLRRINSPLLRYGPICVFASFVTDFPAFAVLYLAV